MVIESFIQGYDKFLEFFQNFDSEGKIVNILFSGEKIDGASWCSDCVEGCSSESS